MPPTARDYVNISGVSHRTDDGVFYVDGRYLCQRLENGTPCNREVSGTRHSISSHNNHFHADSSYRQQMARGEFDCREDDCNHRSPTFAAILAHMRRRHDFRGSSDELKIYYGLPISRKRIDEVVADPSSVYEESPLRIEEKGQEEGPQGESHREEIRQEENHQEHYLEADNNGETEDEHGTAVPLYLIDPRLINWNKNSDSGPGGGGSSSSG